MTNEYWQNDSHKFHSIDNVEREILLPYVASIINKLNPQTLLDYGCGTSYLASLIKTKTEISLYDINPDIINRYKNWEINNIIIPIRNKEKIKTNYYDIVVQSSVLMCLPTIDAIKDILCSNYNALKNGGSLIVVITHPCFLQYNFGHYYTSFNHLNFHYLKNELEYDVYMKESDGSTIVFKDYNWNLSTIINEIIKTGFTITRLIEHPDLQSKYYEPNKLVAPWLFITAKKNYEF